MEARKFYDKKIEENSTLGTVQLMEEYAKHVIAENSDFLSYQLTQIFWK